MPLPEPNLYPAFNTIRLSHAALTVTDLAASRRFYEEIVGLQVTHADNDNLFFRGLEERGHHCLWLRRGDAPAAHALSFKVFAEEDLDRAEAYFTERGQKTAWVERPFQGRTLATTDCFGLPIEFYHSMERLAPIHQKYALYHGVKPLRIDHFNCFTPDVDESVAFWNDLGFRVTEYTEDAATKRLWAAWMHRKGGVHDMAFTNGVGPRLHHLAFWVPTPLAIIEFLDLMASSGYVSSIERGPGRHGISNAFFVYVRDPDGHRVEFYCSDYQTVDPDMEPIHWDLTDPQRQTLWGAPAPRSWFEEGTLFDGLKPREASLKAQPIVAP